MQPGEIEPYVLHRLRHVGWNGTPELDPTMWVRMHKATAGIPRKINQVMTRLLLLGAVEQQGILEADMLESVLSEMHGEEDAVEIPLAQRLPPDRNVPASEAIARAQQQARPGPAREASEGGLLEAQITAIEKAFAERDRHLDALRGEVERIAALGNDSSDEVTVSPSLDARLTRIEARLDEQEQSLRQVLTMMIDYFEQVGPRAAA